MDRFETQFEDLDVATGYYENATTSATAVGTPQEDVDRLMNQVADEAGVELHQENGGREGCFCCTGEEWSYGGGGRWIGREIEGFEIMK